MADKLPSYVEDVSVSKNAFDTFAKRYLKRYGDKMESVAELYFRVADNISKADTNYDSSVDRDAITKEFYEMLAKKRFSPNSPTLMNAGRELQQLSGCFVLPIHDSMESIGNTYRDAMLVHKSGGGTGFSFSQLRPAQDVVLSTSGTASGPISFMKVFNTVTEVVKQGGTRRGANMAILRADHPDIETFITCKDTESTLTNFNISVALNQEFMKAAEEDREYDLVNPRTQQPVRKVKAKEILRQIAECAWRNGEPGIVFLDRINRDNPTDPKYFTGNGYLPPGVGVIESTNPCGEQPLLPYESCNLGSINLAQFVDDDGNIDYEELGKTVDSSVHFLDNVIDMNKYPTAISEREKLGLRRILELYPIDPATIESIIGDYSVPPIEKVTKSNRKIGLGVMGFADALIKMGIPYDSEKGVETGEHFMKFIQERSKKASHELAEKRGAFPNFKNSKYAGGEEIRNAATTTIAPTGSISMLNDCSNGIEPPFAFSATKTVMDNNEMYYFNEYLQRALVKEGIDKNIEIMKKIVDKGRPRIVDGVPRYMQQVFATAHDVTPEWHVKMQAAFQKYTDNAVSKTINLPNSATVEDVRNAFELAYKLGCKGLTIYRDGSRKTQVYDIGKKGKAIKAFESHPQIKSKKSYYGSIKTGEGTLHATMTFDDDDFPDQLFLSILPLGSSKATSTSLLGLLGSRLWQKDDPDYITFIKDLGSAKSDKPIGMGPNRIDSIPHATSIFVRDTLLKEGVIEQDENGILVQKKHKKNDGKKSNGSSTFDDKKGIDLVCSSCGSRNVSIESGCREPTCHDCGEAKCG